MTFTTTEILALAANRLRPCRDRGRIHDHLAEEGVDVTLGSEGLE